MKREKLVKYIKIDSFQNVGMNFAVLCASKFR